MIVRAATLLLLAGLSGCVVPSDAADSGWTDTGAAHTGLIDTGAHDSGETCVADTGVDTGEASAETGVIDSAPDSAETGGIADSADTADTGDTGDTGEEPAILPSGPIVVYAVRHAEKDTEGDDPSLTEEGKARAEALAVLMHDEPLAAIYASELVRTQETVQPTADDHGLPVLCDIDPGGDLAEYILLNHGDETVLSAGHSYTLPDLIEALGVTELPDSYDYGDLWIIRIDVDGTATIEESRFGE